MKHIKVKEIAYGRSGDKGDISNIGIIPYQGRDYDLLRETLTEEFVADLYEPVVDGDITRYEYPEMKALNFVMYEALHGGVSRSLNLDTHGKSRHSILLHSEIEVEDSYSPPETIDGEKVWTRD
jgi:hypothetical protein